MFNSSLPILRLCRSFILVATLAVASSVVRAQTADSSFYGISKELQYTQNSAAAPVLNTPNGALFSVSSLDNTAGSFRTPAGVTTPVKANEEFQARFATRAAMDAAYPDGTYTLTINGANIPLALGSSTYPSAPPQVTNGTWTNGRLVIDPTRDVTIEFNATAGWGSTGVLSYAYFSLWEGDGDDIIAVNRISTEQAGPVNTVTIPARTLTAGRVYNVEVYRFHAAVVDRTSIPGSYGFAGNANQTTFQISAVNPANSAPVITAQPVALTMATANTAVLTVAATGQPAPTYQWRRDGVALPNETRPTMILFGSTGSVRPGSYDCVVTNSGGSVTSAPAALTVNNVPATDVGRLINLSVLAPTGPGAQLLTMGATVGGQGAAGALPLVIRGVGPTLGGFGVAGTLADPVLSIFPAGSTTASVTNDNWGGAAALVTAFTNVGAFAMTPASLDSAALQNQAAGAFTVQVAGKGAATGMVLAEVYDAAGATRIATTPRLTNLSTLTAIAPGGNLTAGFVIGGTTARTVLVRSVGPTLRTAFSISTAIDDPKLELFNNAGAKIGENDNWGGTPWLLSAHTAVGAFALGNATTKDASLLITLAPGAYSARVSGVNSSGGTAIIEVYEMP